MAKVLDEEKYPEVSSKYLRYLKYPYGGLFGNTIQTRILDRIVANPSRTYRPKDFKEMLGISTNSITKALNELTELNVLKKISKDKQRPEYETNLDSKQLLALTFLAYAVNDDRDGTDYMDHAIEDYCYDILRPKREKIEPISITGDTGVYNIIKVKKTEMKDSEITKGGVAQRAA